MRAAGAKGPGRPMLRAPDRAELVAALRGVDYVTIFREPTVDAAADAAPARRALQGHRLHRRDRARARHGARLRRPHRHRRRSQGSFDARSARAHPRMNILIVRLGALGDIVHAVPAAAAIRAAYPGRAHRLAGRREAPRDARARGLRRSRRFRWKGAAPADGWTPSARLRRERYDVALDLQGLMKSAVLARASGAARVAGFSSWRLREGPRGSSTPMCQTTGPEPAGDARDCTQPAAAADARHRDGRGVVSAEQTPSAALDAVRGGAGGRSAVRAASIRGPPGPTSGGPRPATARSRPTCATSRGFARSCCGGLARPPRPRRSSRRPEARPRWRRRRQWPMSSRCRERRRWSCRATPVRCISPRPRDAGLCRSSGRPTRNGTGRARRPTPWRRASTSAAAIISGAAIARDWCLGGLPASEVTAAIRRRLES